MALDMSHVREVSQIEHGELLDDYPLAAYSVGGLCLASLKRHINLPLISHGTVNNKIMLGRTAAT